MGFDVVVVGSGAGGLVAARILAKEGKKVLVAEKHNRLGGYLQRFYRDKIPFDTGLHYVGRLAPGSCLRAYLEYLGVWDAVRFHELDREGFDRVRFPGADGTPREIRIPAGRAAFRERLREEFPLERAAVDRFCDEVARVTRSFPLYSFEGDPEKSHDPKVLLHGSTLGGFLDSVGASPDLALALGGQSFLHGTPPARVPFWVHALVTDSFVADGAWGIDGGGDALARALARGIKADGGEVRLGCGVAGIRVASRAVQGVTLTTGEVVEAPLVVAAIHPRRALELLPDGATTPAYASRVKGLEESIGSLALYLRMNRRFESVGPWNSYWLRTRDLDAAFRDRTNNPKGPDYLFLTWPSVRDPSWRYPDNMIALAPVQLDELDPWTASSIDARPDEYVRWKERAAGAVLATLDRELPGFRGSCDLLSVSTPLTNRHYTGSQLGSNYGVLQSAEQQGLYKLPVRTRVHGLYLAGQSVGLMGLMGVTVTSFRVAGEILGLSALFRKVRGE